MSNSTIRLRLARWMFGTAVFSFVVYASTLGVAYRIQNQLIFTGARREGRSAAVPVPKGAKLMRLRTANGTSIEALFAPALHSDGSPYPVASRRPGMLLFYGNSSSLRGMVGRVEKLRRCGVHVLAPEYVGYGGSGGAPSEQGCYETADATYDYLMHCSEVDPQRLVVFGHSLGGAVAIDLASRVPVAGLVTFGTFTSLEPIAAKRYWWAPVSLFLNQRFSSQDKIARVRCPILMFHGTADEVIPYEHMSRLAAAARAPVTTVNLDAGEHRMLLSTSNEEPLKHLIPWLQHLWARSAKPTMSSSLREKAEPERQGNE